MNYDLKKVVKDGFKVFIVIEYLLNFYTFPLIAEIIILPIFVFIGITRQYADSQSEYLLVAKLLKFVQSLFGFLLLSYVIYQTVSHFDDLIKLETLRQFTLPLLLTILFVPYVYLYMVYACYEPLFRRIEWALKADAGLKKYTKRKVIQYCGINLSLLRLVVKRLSFDVWHIKDRGEIDQFFEKKMFNIPIDFS